MGSGAVLFIALLVVVLGVAALGIVATKPSDEPESELVTSDSTPEVYAQRAAQYLQGASGHEVVNIGGGTLLVRWTHTPSSRYLIAVVFFPLGLLALRGTRTDVGFIHAKVANGRTTISLEGVLSPAIRAKVKQTVR